MMNRGVLGVRLTVLLALFVSGMPARAGADDGIGWIAATHGLRRFLTRSGEDIGTPSLQVGLDVETSTAINVRPRPAVTGARPIVLPAGSSFKIIGKRLVKGRSGTRLWLLISAPGGSEQIARRAGSLYGRREQKASELQAINLVDACKKGLDAQIAAQGARANTEDRDIYFDTDGLIVHRAADGSCDGGDTAQREGWYWLGVKLRQNMKGAPPWTPTRRLSFDQVLKLLEPRGDGVFYRHPTLAPWNNPFSKDLGTSRDQLTPLIAAMGVWGKTAALKRLWEALPRDALGLHAFNGEWRTIGGAGWDCGAIKRTSCGATMNCSPNEDTRSCEAQTDVRDCSLDVDTRDCSQPKDERSCNNGLFNDPFCEAAKAAQNAIYDHNKLVCETAKAGANLGHSAGKASCEASKSAQNAMYAGSKLACEAAKASQNGLYGGLKLLCETAKSGGKGACEAYKTGAYKACTLSNLFSGDFFGPEYINLFYRAFNIDPLTPHPPILVPGTEIVGGALGEAELLANTHGRIGAGHSDRNDVGPDLNHIVALLMSKIKYPTLVSQSAVHEYAAQRSESFGSYLSSYYTQYGVNGTDLIPRIEAGVAGGWKPDAGVSPIYGVLRWYHRPTEGANPQLAKLYEPIVAYYLK